MYNATIRRCYINGKKAAILTDSGNKGRKAFLLTNIAAIDNSREILRCAGYNLYSFAAATEINADAEITGEIARVFGGTPVIVWENTPAYDAIINNRPTRNRAKKSTTPAPATQPQPAPAPTSTPAPNGSADVLGAFVQAIQAANAQTIQMQIDAAVQTATAALRAEMQEAAPTTVTRCCIKPGEKSSEITGVLPADFDKIRGMIEADIPVYVYGPAGTGKSFLAGQLATATGRKLYASNALTDEFLLVGSQNAAGDYIPSTFYQAWTNGGLFLLDEMDASDPYVLAKLNMAIANGVCDFPVIGNVSKNPDFRVIGAGNTAGGLSDGQYTAREKIDAATLNRFTRVYYGYNPAVELALSGNNKPLCAFIQAIRACIAEKHIPAVVSYRQTINIAKMLACTAVDDNGNETPVFTAVDAVRYAITNGLSVDDINLLAEYTQRLGGEYADALQAIAQAV